MILFLCLFKGTHIALDFCNILLFIPTVLSGLLIEGIEFSRLWPICVYFEVLVCNVRTSFATSVS